MPKVHHKQITCYGQMTKILAEDKNIRFITLIIIRSPITCDWECLGDPLMIFAFPGQRATTVLIIASINSEPLSD